MTYPSYSPPAAPPFYIPPMTIHGSSSFAPYFPPFRSWAAVVVYPEPRVRDAPRPALGERRHRRVSCRSVLDGPHGGGDAGRGQVQSRKGWRGGATLEDRGPADTKRKCKGLMRGGGEGRRRDEMSLPLASRGAACRSVTSVISGFAFVVATKQIHFSILQPVRFFLCLFCFSTNDFIVFSFLGGFTPKNLPRAGLTFDRSTTDWLCHLSFFSVKLLFKEKYECT